MRELWLPTVPEGSYFFSKNIAFRFLCIAAQNEQWIALCKGTAFFSNVPIECAYGVPLGKFNFLEIEHNDKKHYLFINVVNKERLAFCNYHISSNVQISIGSHPSNDIFYDNPHVSRKHAVLTRTDGNWSIQDCGSTFGTYVNGKRCKEATLKLGDVVSLFGLKCIVGPDVLAISSHGGKQTINDSKLIDLKLSPLGYSNYGNQGVSQNEERFFNRSPRKRTLHQQKKIVVEGPPMSMNQAQMPLMLRMGSSMVMGGAAALGGNYLTLLSSVLFPVLSSKFTDEQKKEYEKLRITKYTEYLEQKRQEICQACTDEQLALNHKYPELQQLLSLGVKKMWERRPTDSDFLHVRLGSGKQLLSAELDYPPRHFQMETDSLEEKMYELVEHQYYLEDMRSMAKWCIIPIQDYMGLGNDCRINTPSTIGCNWRWRATEEQLSYDLACELRTTAMRYGRMNWNNYKEY